MSINSTEKVLFSLGMEKTSVKSIDSFETFLIEHKAVEKSLSEQGLVSDCIITITDGENIVVTTSVRFIDIDINSGFGFVVTTPAGKQSRFTYRNTYKVFMKSRMYSDLWD